MRGLITFFNKITNAINWKWIISIFIIGLIPIFIRLLMFSLSSAKGFDVFRASDLNAFALMLCITNIGVLAHDMSIEREFSTKSIYISIALIAFISAILAATSFHELTILLADRTFEIVNYSRIKIFSGIFVFVSICVSYVVWDRIAHRRGVVSGRMMYLGRQDT